jgi:hypothetical protein
LCNYFGQHRAIRNIYIGRNYIQPLKCKQRLHQLRDYGVSVFIWLRMMIWITLQLHIYLFLGWWYIFIWWLAGLNWFRTPISSFGVYGLDSSFGIYIFISWLNRIYDPNFPIFFLIESFIVIDFWWFGCDAWFVISRYSSHLAFLWISLICCDCSIQTDS